MIEKLADEALVALGGKDGTDPEADEARLATVYQKLQEIRRLAADKAAEAVEEEK